MSARRLPWSAQEIATLRELAGTLTATKIGARLGRSRWAVLGMIPRLGLPGAPHGSPLRFSAEEDRLVRAGISRGLTGRKIAEQLPGRSRHAVWTRARALNSPTVSPWWWTEEQNAVLRDAAGKLTARELAKRLGRSAKAVRSQALMLGVELMRWKPEEMRGYWSPELEARLRGLAPTHTPTQAAAELGRTDRSVRLRAAKIGLRMRDGRKRQGQRSGISGERAASARKVGKPRTATVKASIALMPALRRPAASEVSRLEWCPECHAPVSNWAQHYERSGHRRRA